MTPWKAKALSLSGLVTEMASDALATTSSTLLTGGMQMRLQDVAAAAAEVAALRERTVEKKRSGGTDRNASRPASMVLMISFGSPVAASVTALPASGATALEVRPLTTGYAASATEREAS